MLTQGIGDSYRRATEYNPALNKLGNAAEAINGSADIIKNVIGAAGEIIGTGDAVQSIGAGIDIATMHGLDLLSTENKIKAVSNLDGLSQFQNNATETVRDWAVRNPNAAQGAKALGNIAKATQQRHLRGAAGPGCAQDRGIELRSRSLLEHTGAGTGTLVRAGRRAHGAS